MEYRNRFKLNAVGEIIRIPCDIQEETWQIKEVILSPLGVTLKGEGKGTKTEKIKCSIQLKSGEVEQFDSVSTSNQLGDIIMKFTTQVPLDISEVMAIQVNENIIKAKPFVGSGNLRTEDKAMRELEK